MKVTRAWNGKLKYSDDLMSWLYDKDILTKTDKNRKDMLFNQYYRYYNDGDVPRFAGSRYTPKKEVESKLEERIENFISEMLSKYADKFDRNIFRFDSALGKLNTVLRVVDDNEFYSFATYWIDTVKDKNSKLSSIAKKVKVELSNFKKLIPEEYNNYISTYVRKSLREKNEWTSVMEESYKKLVTYMIDASEILGNLIIKITKTKKLYELSK